MTVRFHPLISDTDHFPKAKVPILPVMNFGMGLGASRPDSPSRFMASDPLFLRSGRVALAHAFQAAGVGRGDTVLIPAYHCVAMVEPAIWLQATIVFYHLNPDLSADLNDLATKLRQGVKALLLPHYFGFPQPLVVIRRLCDRHGVKLIEDCAHAFFGQTQGCPLGSVGDFAIASTMKFFPGMDGGMLCANRRPLEYLGARTPGLHRQLQAIANSIEIAATYRRLGPLGCLARLGFRLADKFRHQRVENETIPHEPDKAADNLSRMHWFCPTDLGQAGSWVSLWLLRGSHKAAVVRRRREHYQYMLERLRHVPRAWPLFPELPSTVVPYVFPLMLEHPEHDFSALKACGVPIWRWEELAESDCQVSLQYRLRLLQLPCHQALRRWELDWMISTIIKILSINPSVPSHVSYA